MCTAVSVILKDHYFGRNLDLEYHYNEEVVITPRNYPYFFRGLSTVETHYAIIGIATVIDNYPLYYDAVNEYGLAIAGLNFPGNAVYHNKMVNCTNVTPFELIPYILCQCKNVSQARQLLKNVNLYNKPFQKDLPLTPLHWIISDSNSSIVVEPLKEGLQIYENKIGVLSNNPPFDYHQYNIANYMTLSSSVPENSISGDVELIPYSRGMAAIGLPGDLSSASRFVRAAFVKLNSVQFDTEEENAEQFFHILSSVEQQAGCVRLKDGNVRTVYSGCCNTNTGVYYYKTYLNSRITAVHMHKEDLNATQLKRFAMRFHPDILIEKQNKRM